MILWERERAPIGVKVGIRHDRILFGRAGELWLRKAN